MDEDQLWDTTMNPEHRLLRRMNLRDAADAERIFEVLMGNEVAPRREFIVDGAEQVVPELIDA
jgi:DNA gyrase subunit B